MFLKPMASPSHPILYLQNFPSIKAINLNVGPLPFLYPPPPYLTILTPLLQTFPCLHFCRPIVLGIATAF